MGAKGHRQQPREENSVKFTKSQDKNMLQKVALNAVGCKR